jgi:hypothetical protein
VSIKYLLCIYNKDTPFCSINQEFFSSTKGFLKALPGNLSDALILRFLPRSARRTTQRNCKSFAILANFGVHVLIGMLGILALRKLCPQPAVVDDSFGKVLDELCWRNHTNRKIATAFKDFCTYKLL